MVRKSSKTNRYPGFSQATFFHRLILYLIGVILVLTNAAMPARVLAIPLLSDLPAQTVNQDESGAWQLVSNDQFDTWRGDKFHGKESEYTPIYENNTVGAVYTEYNIRFTPDAPKKISQQLYGVCTWNWENGAVPSDVIPGKSYPFNLSVSADITGPFPMMTTVDGYTESLSQNANKGDSIAYTQVYIDPQGTDQRSGTNEINASLSLPTGQSDGEQRRLNLTCKVDHVTVTMQYLYRWGKTACRATLALPDKMEPGKPFFPLATVVDNNNQPVKPQKETWYYNGVNTSSMVWDGKAATVDYEYICPLDNQTRKVSINIPPNEGDQGWLVVVGEIGAVVSAAAMLAGGAALIAANRQKGPKKGTQTSQYILQLNKNYLEIRPKESISLAIQAWRVTPEGVPVAAPEATIQVILPPSAAGLVATPAVGQGTLDCVFTIPKPTECAQLTVTVTASAAGKKVEKQIQVRIIPLYELALTWRDPSQKALKPGEAVWALAKLTATPIDPQSPPDVLAKRISISVKGPNSALIKLQTPLPQAQGPFIKNGVVWIPVTSVQPPPGMALQPGNPSLAAEFVEGTQRLEARLPIGFADQVLGAWVQGKSQADVIYNKRLDTPAWDFAEIVMFFHTSEDNKTPVAPSVKYKFNQPPIEADPPVLEVSEFYPHAQDQYTLKVRLLPGIELEQYFGRYLTERQGVIQVKITAKAEDGKPFTAQVAYRLRPQLELFAHGSDIRGRQYKNLALGSVEFVADGDDQMAILVGCCRTDQSDPRDADQIDQVDPTWWSYQASLQGASDSNFHTYPNQEGIDEERSLIVQSKKPLLYKAGGEREILSLHLEGNSTRLLPGNYLPGNLKFDLELKPRFPDLRAWVVPGKERGTSEVWMLVFLDRNTSQLLGDTILKVKTSSIFTASGNGSAPSLVTRDLQDQTFVITGSDGSEQVDLLYRDLTWSNYQEALFIISCSITNRSGDQESDPVKVSVNVKENIKRLLADLFERADLLKLNNPYWQNRSLGLSNLIDLTVYRPFVRGPIWNACEMLSGNEWKYAKGDKKVKFAHDYVCSEFRDRIAEWLIKRRHYQQGQPDKINDIAKMNGIEFEHFVIANGLHNYEALFLSGMEPTDDPRGLDPWWKQHWQDQAYFDPDQLVSNNWERYYCAETGAWLSVSLIPVVALGLATGGGTLIAIIPLLGPIIAAYSAATTGEVASGRVYSPKDGYKWFKSTPYVGRQIFINNWTTANPHG